MSNFYYNDDYEDPSLTNQNLLALCKSEWVSRSDNPEIILHQIKCVLENFRSNKSSSLTIDELFEAFRMSFQTFEANWIYRYHKRFLWHIAEQCEILFPNHIARQTLDDIAQYLSDHAPSNVLPDFKERVEKLRSDPDTEAKHIWYFVIVYVICRYQTTDYKIIMSLLRGKQSFKDNEVWYYHSQILSKLMYFSPRSHRDMFVFRGVSVWNQEYADIINTAIRTGFMETREYLSSSRNIYEAETFYTKPNPRTGKLAKNNVLFIYELPKGFPMMLFESQFEEEVLLPPCVRWQITYLGTHVRTYEDHEEYHEIAPTYKLTVLHCKPHEIRTLGFQMPTNNNEELMLKLKLAVNIGQYAISLISPNSLQKPTYDFAQFQTSPMYGCYSVPSGTSMIRPDKSIPPPSDEWKNLKIEYTYSGPLSVRPPDHESFYDQLWSPLNLEYTDISTGHRYIAREYEELLLLLLNTEIASGTQTNLLEFRFSVLGAQFFYDFLKKHYPM